MRRAGQIGALTDNSRRRANAIRRATPYSERWKILRPARERDTAFGGRRRPMKTTVVGLQLHRRPRLRSGLRRRKRRHGLTRRLGNRPWRITPVPPHVLGRRFCSEALAIARAICSWFALSCSAVLALSRANSAWLALSCSISCCTLARSRAIVWSNCVCSAGSGRLPPLAARSEPEVAIAKLLRPPQPAEQQAGSAGRQASVLPTATTSSQLRRPPGDHRPDRLAIGLRGESSGTDARRQQQADQAAQRRPASRWLTKPVRGLLLRPGNLFIEPCEFFIRASDLLISVREPFIGARDQLDLLRGQCRINMRGSVCLVFAEASMGASCQFAVN